MNRSGNTRSSITIAAEVLEVVMRVTVAAVLAVLLLVLCTFKNSPARVYK